MLRRILCALGVHQPILVESVKGGRDGETVWYGYWCARVGCKWSHNC